jgi:TRAP-type C4-dicarboxylate transport system substrate-binding protein
MKIRRFTPIAACILLIAVAGVGAQGRIRIRVGTVVPKDTHWHHMFEYIAQDWRRIVGPQLRVDIFAGLGDEHDLVRKARSGEIQALGLSSVGLSRIDRGVACLQVPMMLESYAELDYIRDALAPQLEQRIEQRGFKVLHWADGGWVYPFSKRPVRTPDDLRRQKLFTSAGDPVTEKLYTDMGFAVTPASASDLALKLQAGKLEAFALVPLFAQIDLFKLAPNMTDMPWTPLVGGTVITLEAWNSLPEQHRAALLDAARKPGQRLRDDIRRMDREAIKEMQHRGLNVVALSAADRKLWQSEAEKAYGKMRGDYCPAELFDDVLRLRDEFRAKARTTSTELK